MGNFEDDRIRSKNAVHNAAFEAYSTYVNTNMTDSDIEKLCNDFIANNNDSIRNEIFLTILKIVRSNREQTGS